MAAELPLKALAVSDYRPTSSGVSPTPSSYQSEDSRLQSEMKTIIGGELKSATFFVDLTASILPVNHSTVQDVADDLKSTFDHLTDHDNSTPAEPRFPKAGFGTEASSYLPFTHLLNKIIDTANRRLPPSYLTRLRFHSFGKEMSDAYGSHRGLKPDGIGILGELPLATKELPWERIEVTIESKKAVKDLVRQSGTYARCCLLSNQRRSFSLVIGFDFSKLEAYFFLFNRSGLSSSYPLKLATREGFEGLVRHIVAILSIPDEAAYGLDPTRFQDVFCINNSYYKVDRPLYVRDSLRGRATVVHSLHGTRDTPERGLKSRTLTLSRGVGSLPDKFIYKQAYSIKGRSQEGPLFSKFNGRFGVAEIIGYHNCGPQDPYGSTGRYFTDAEFWDVFKDKSFHKPEERRLQCIALAEEGKALVDLQNADGGTPSPGVLLESILHAIIGHYNLFRKGVLHRDISSGNVLRYPEPIERPALSEFECTRDVKLCRGFVIDGDNATEWRKVTSTREISGTMHFMSMRILGRWQGHESVFHTALDDLESFLWLLIWCIVHVSKDIEGARANNRGIDSMLRAWSGDATANLAKLSAAERSWKDAVFGSLIKEWLTTLGRMDEETSGLTEFLSTHEVNNDEGSRWTRACDRLESFCKKAYAEILHSGFKHLKGVQRYSDWEAVVAANEPTMDLDF